MTDKKTKKEKAGYEIGYLRRATVDAEYNYIELNVKFDPSKIDCKTVVQDTETMVVFARELTATEAPKIGKGIFKEKLEEATKEVGKTEDIKIAELQAGDKSLNLNVRFGTVGALKSFTKNDGSEGLLRKIPVEDEAGDKIILTAWDKQTSEAQGIKRNAWVFLQNAYVTEYKGTLELNVSDWSKMDVKYNG